MSAGVEELFARTVGWLLVRSFHPTPQLVACIKVYSRWRGCQCRALNFVINYSWSRGVFRDSLLRCNVPTAEKRDQVLRAVLQHTSAHIVIIGETCFA